MTETTDAAVIDEALTVIDRSLAQMGSRELVSAAEVSDLLLDLRLLLMAADGLRERSAEGALPG